MYTTNNGIKRNDDDDMEVNLATGTMQRKITKAEQEGETWDPITGQYIMVEKSDKPLWPSLVSEPVEKFDGAFEKFIPIIVVEKADKDEHIVMGIVYEPDVEDSQGDSASAEEIKKACFQFMEDHVGFKVMHKGDKVKVQVLENYIAPVDFTIEGKVVKAGSWVMTTRINDAKIWKAIKSGKLTGYSMAGQACSEDEAA